MEKDVDVFAELYGGMASYTYPQKPRQQPQYIKPPTHPYAYSIWKECALSDNGEPPSIVEEVLVDWVLKKNLLKERDADIYVEWKTNTISFSAKWTVFLKWFMY